ncbi:MAG TPA: 2OG-Fe(II) oxygenase [Kofleriaceae bacterium]|nr:2OG-Fe(II) oxygenase [Kofleriaceae bacterium]
MAAAWRAAAPFPHLVLDDVVEPERQDELMAIVDDEPAHAYEGEIFRFDATAPEPTTAAFRALRDDFAATFAPALARITGKAVARVDMRGFAYGAGHYLLPHTDHQDGLGRAIAYACYLPTAVPPAGGELELFRCTHDGRELTETEPALTIAPRPGRLAIFDVSLVSLHQVREVLRGLRLSLAGWFYP